MFHRFHTKIGQFLLHIITQTASVQVKHFSAAIYQWRPGASNALKMWGGHCLSKHRLIQGKFMVGRCPWVPGLQGLACHSEKWGGQSICCPPLYKKWGGHVPPVPHLSTPIGDLRLTLADAGFHLSVLFFLKNTVFGTISRTTVLQNLTETMSYAVKPIQTPCEELRDGQEARTAESSVCFLDFCRFFYFLTIRKHLTGV